MSAFRKSILAVGSYRSPEGAIHVTTDRLKHWEKSVRKIQSANYQIPVHWNHADITDTDHLSPIHRMSATPAQAERTVGRLVDFQVARDGQSAEIVVETLTPSATEAVESNAVFVSPVLFDQWQDGRGESYSDIIGSVDLVDLPVDNSQSRFQPTAMMSTRSVIRMSTKPKQIFRLSTEAKMDAENENETPDADPQQPETPPTTPESPSMLSEVITGLAAMKIMLPSDTNTANFLDRLNVALMTVAAQDPEPEKENTEVVDPSPAEPETPAIATMSTRINQLESRLLEGEKKAVRDRLDALLKSGRCSPAEFDAKSKVLGVQRMSLATDGTVNRGAIGDWVSDRESIPEGAFWDPAQKIQRMSASPQPDKFKTKGDSSPDVETMKRQKAEMLRR